MAEQDPIQSFRDFVQSLSSARHGTVQSLTGSKVESEDAFEEMRQHLVATYRGVEARHTFLEAGGQIVDCIPIDQQPAIRDSADVVATPPTLPPAPAGYDGQPEGAPASRLAPPSQLESNLRDRHGNQMSCPPGTIPVVRVTLDTITRFRNLHDFFRKAPGGGRLPDRTTGSGGPVPFGAAAVHKYAHAFQAGNNLGGSSFLNTWQPAIGAHQIFSLSQHWYVNGSGSGVQTAECGWQVFPALYNTNKPCLFIYWTRANYAEGSGCYNLTCPAFVQTNPNVVIGGTLAVSTPGGPQFEYKMGFFLSGGNWWFYLGDQPVGYYPGALYQGGAMSFNAATIDYGGETVGEGTWPPMGSGQFPASGGGFASWQRNIVSFPTSGGAVEATLTPFEPSPGCYKIGLANHSGTAWGTYFYHGGPGGIGC